MFGKQKINLHEAGHEFEPKAFKPTPGSADLCFVTSTPIDNVMKHLKQKGVVIEEGPVTRTGAQEELLSVYIRDVDQVQCYLLLQLDVLIQLYNRHVSRKLLEVSIF